MPAGELGQTVHPHERGQQKQGPEGPDDDRRDRVHGQAEGGGDQQVHRAGPAGGRDPEPHGDHGEHRRSSGEHRLTERPTPTHAGDETLMQEHRGREPDRHFPVEHRDAQENREQPELLGAEQNQAEREERQSGDVGQVEGMKCPAHVSG